MFGVINSNYSGINRALINPSFIADSKLYLDINLFTGNVFLENNCLYISKRNYSLLRLLSRNPNFQTYGSGEIFRDEYNSLDKYFYANVRINGPSAMMNIGRHAFGFYEGFRTTISANDVPYHTAKLLFGGLPYKQLQDKILPVEDFKTAKLVWSELAFCYAYSIIKNKLHFLSAGISIKYEMGLSGLYFNNINSEFSSTSDSTIVINNLNADYGYCNSSAGNKGFAFDFGITYEKKPNESTMQFKKLCQQKYIEYFYKVGLSLLDFGSINFKNGTSNYNFSNTSLEFIGLRKVQELNSVLQAYDSTNYHNSNSFKISLPKAFSAQLDIHPRKNFYINSTLIQSINLGKNLVRRPSQLSLTPRFEKRWIEFAVPVSLIDYKYLRWGVAFRIFNLTIGTEKFIGFTDIKNFSGLDFYISLKLNYAKGKCNKSTNWRNFKIKITEIYKCASFQ